MLNRIDDLVNRNESFAFETTLATRSYRLKIEEAKNKGYTTTLLFLWLQNVELAKQRVRIRVTEGGHTIEPEVIERRYRRGIKNLFEIYLPDVDGALIYDNSAGEPHLLAQKTVDGKLTVINKTKFNELKYCYDHS
ncbi:zeta toxin family protein [Salmonirosea aquatica]|uniref:zeta toxin family protein n=1 Tax=Salmonirosea aquatica TaxID=2654236 RepID=UPI003571073A